jgi:uncharacterized protein YutE (UPF0331/DUF86 family)
MSPLNISTIQDKLFRLKENINFIQDILKSTDKEIINSPSLYFGLEHLLQLSIQIILDIGSHILAEEFKENPSTYQDIIVYLGKNGIIEDTFADSQSEMAKFRNKLVHDYDTIDKEKVVEYARLAPGVFQTFGKSFTAFLEKKQ